MEKNFFLPCESLLLLLLWNFLGPVFSLTEEHAHLPVLGEKAHLTTYSFCLSIARQDLEKQDKAEKGRTS